MAVPVFLIGFDCVNVAISFLAFVRFGQGVECESTKTALLQQLDEVNSLLGQIYD